jgi:hypothetical protein
MNTPSSFKHISRIDKQINVNMNAHKICKCLLKLHFDECSTPGSHTKRILHDRDTSHSLSQRHEKSTYDAMCILFESLGSCIRSGASMPLTYKQLLSFTSHSKTLHFVLLCVSYRLDKLGFKPLLALNLGRKSYKRKLDDDSSTFTKLNISASDSFISEILEVMHQVSSDSQGFLRY